MTRPNAFERVLNRVFGALVGLGLGLSHNYRLEVRGRKTGRLRALPVNVLDLEGRRFLVAPRGRTEWTRNAEVAGEITLKKGSKQQFFPVRAGSPAEAFVAIADRYPVFELIGTGR